MPAGSHSSDKPARHYPSGGAKCADLVVHVTGLCLALIFGAALLVIASRSGTATMMVTLSIYFAGLLAMLSFSTLYNFAPGRLRPKFNRLDHIGIFLMIAASYTPFTIHALSGTWSIAMTSLVWTLAGAGMLGKIFIPHANEKLWTALYIALGWVVLIALKPLASALSPAILILLAVGGVIYTIGTLFFLNKTLTYARAIWHGHVVAGAACHWVAILLAVPLAVS